MSEPIHVKFDYGALAPSIEEQANVQGLTLGDKAEFLESLRKARTLLMFHVCTNKQTFSITQKIHKLVIQNLQLLEPVPAARRAFEFGDPVRHVSKKLSSATFAGYTNKGRIRVRYNSAHPYGVVWTVGIFAASNIVSSRLSRP